MIEANGRCRSWKPGARPHEPRHDPGRCRRCWVPCRNKVPRDGATVRCEECTEAILALHVPRLSRMLLEETYVPSLLTERLSTDLDAGVALAARERLAAADPPEPPEKQDPTAELHPVQAAAEPSAQDPVPDSAAEPSDQDSVEAVAAPSAHDSVEDLYSVKATAAPSDQDRVEAAVPGEPQWQDDGDTDWSVEW